MVIYQCPWPLFNGLHKWSTFIPNVIFVFLLLCCMVKGRSKGDHIIVWNIDVKFVTCSLCWNMIIMIKVVHVTDIYVSNFLSSACIVSLMCSRNTLDYSIIYQIHWNILQILEQLYLNHSILLHALLLREFAKHFIPGISYRELEFKITLPLSLQHASWIQSLLCCVISCGVLCLLSLLYPVNDVRLLGSFITEDNRILRTSSLSHNRESKWSLLPSRLLNSESCQLP
jgi:hypothetical protein